MYFCTFRSSAYSRLALFQIKLRLPTLHLYEVYLQKPDYSSEKCNIGAHITITYPNEQIVINDQDINVIHSFKIEELAKTQTENKQYYVLKISSPSLISLRKKISITYILKL